MKFHINRRAAWLAPLAIVALGACGGSSDPRSMEQVFGDMEDVAAEAHALVPSDEEFGFDDINDELIKKMAPLMDQHGDLYDELADVAPAEYQEQMRECADFNHTMADASKGGFAMAMAAAMALGEEDPEAVCQETLTELGGPNLT